jgi:hypothetical protein
MGFRTIRNKLEKNEKEDTPKAKASDLPNANENIEDKANER